MFVFVFLCCVVLCRSSKGILTSVLIRLRNLQCKVAKVLTRTVEPLMMMISRLKLVCYKQPYLVMRLLSRKLGDPLRLGIDGDRDRDEWLV
jgi:hypothetical protein